MLQKTIGYLLLSVGLFTIIFSTLSLYEVFTGHKSPPQLISQSALKLDISGLVTGLSANQKPTELLSADTVNTTTNLFIYFILMSFIAGSGFKIATLGVQLLRPINIHSSVLS